MWGNAETGFILFYILHLHISSVACDGEVVGYNQKCDNYRQCRQSRYLLCRSEKCECTSPLTMVFDPSTGSCVSKLNNLCYLEETYTQNYISYEIVISQESLKVHRKTKCVPNAFCNELTQVCECNPGLIADQNGTCVSGSNYHKTCDYAHNKCPPETGLVCKNGRCQCEFTELQYFNGSQCLSRVGGPCQDFYRPDDPFHLICTPHAECRKNGGLHNMCLCTSGYIRNKDGKCDLGYGQTCNSSDITNNVCSSTGLLECVEGRCQCSDRLHLFDESEQRCRGLVGAYCKVNDISNKFCVTGATCRAASVLGEENGYCECMSALHYVENENRICLYTFPN